MENLNFLSTHVSPVCDYIADLFSHKPIKIRRHRCRFTTLASTTLKEGQVEGCIGKRSDVRSEISPPAFSQQRGKVTDFRLV